MRKIFVIILVNLSFCIYSIEYHTYQMEVEDVFSASHEGEKHLGDLSIFIGDTNPGAEGPGIFFIEDQLVISDQAYYKNNRKTIFLDNKYNFKNVYNNSHYQMTVINIKNNHLGFNNSYIKSFNSKIDWENNFNITTYDFKIFRNYKDLYFQDNTLFIFDKDYKLWAIKNPGLDADENRNNIISEDEIINEINNDKYQGLSIDSEKRLFYQGQYKTLLYKKYVNYLSTLRSGYAGSIKGFNYDYKTLAKFKMETYIGSDLDGNKYWCSSRTVIVISSNGLLKDIFRYDDDLSDTYPAVSPEGDVYFMNYGVDNVTLYKVERKW